MASDPYHTFASDLRSSLRSAQDLGQSYQDLRRSVSPSSPSLREAHDRLLDALEALQGDVADVKESVDVVERSGPERFGVAQEELEERRRFVKSCTEELRKLSDIAGRRQGDSKPSFRSIDMGSRADEEGDEDPNEAFEREQQQHLMARQDDTLSLIGNTLTSLKRQAGTFGQEIGEQVELIGALDTEVDSSQSKLGRAMGKMDEMVRRGDERLGGWCVWILILVLFILLLIVVLI